jgi:hypothetical protein
MKTPTETEVLARVAKLIESQQQPARGRIVEYIYARYSDSEKPDR